MGIQWGSFSATYKLPKSFGFGQVRGTEFGTPKNLFRLTKIHSNVPYKKVWNIALIHFPSRLLRNKEMLSSDGPVRTFTLCRKVVLTFTER